VTREVGALDVESGAIVPSDIPGRERSLIKWTSRTGAWGLGGAFVPVIALSLGAPISAAAAITAMAAGFVVGGISTAWASVLVRRRCPPDARALRLAATLGAPLGAAFAAVGVSTLMGWELVGQLGGLGLAGLSVAVVVLLVGAFVQAWNRAAEDVEERPGRG
jgi:hypothetical protein